jgi:Fic family protein
MIWNWQQKDWPVFHWDNNLLLQSEQQFSLNAGVLIGSVKHLDPQGHEQLILEVLTTEAITSSQIEGEILDRASVQSSIRRQLGFMKNQNLTTDEQGIPEIMVDVCQNWKAPLDHQTLFSWHQKLFQSQGSLEAIGKYRIHEEPMQIISGLLTTPKVHFEAPPSFRVPKEMDLFIEWFHSTSPQGKNPLPAITRAGITHLYFVSIHPFEDGNGRIARALSEKSLAQSLNQPALTSLAATLLDKRKHYYDALEIANKNNDISHWLEWFAGITLEAQKRTVDLAGFMIKRSRLSSLLKGQLNSRQEKVLDRMFKDWPQELNGGLSSANYRKITGASEATATRDLFDMVEKGALIRLGEKRHTRYYLSIHKGSV